MVLEEATPQVLYTDATPQVLHADATPPVLLIDATPCVVELADAMSQVVLWLAGVVLVWCLCV